MFSIYKLSRLMGSLSGNVAVHLTGKSGKIYEKITVKVDIEEPKYDVEIIVRVLDPRLFIKENLNEEAIQNENLSYIAELPFCEQKIQAYEPKKSLNSHLNIQIVLPIDNAELTSAIQKEPPIDKEIVSISTSKTETTIKRQAFRQLRIIPAFVRFVMYLWLILLIKIFSH